MALTMKELERLVKNEGFKYFRDPDRDALMLGAAGINGRYQFVILLEVEGQFLQFRTIGYKHCPADHSNLTALLKVLGALNYELRLVKFGWDASDGEIVAYGDLWIMDSKLTQKQFSRMLHNYLQGIDLNLDRINQTIETGKDPGRLDPKAIVERLLGAAGGLPPKLRDKIKELEKKQAQEEKDEKKKKKKKKKKVETI